jgi:hypothetical protein
MRIVAPALAVSFLAACSSVPDITQVNLPKPDFSSFAPTDWNVFAKTEATSKPVGPEDFVDGQGHCPGSAEPAPDASAGATPTPVVHGGVALGMAECEVVRAAGQPQNVEISTNEHGDRNVIITYQGGDRSGIYRFVAGRLVSIERGPEPAAPEKKKPVAKKRAKKAPSA